MEKILLMECVCTLARDKNAGRSKAARYWVLKTAVITFFLAIGMSSVSYTHLHTGIGVGTVNIAVVASPAQGEEVSLSAAARVR